MRWHKAVGRYYDFVKDIIEADKCSNYEMSLPHGTCQENIIRNVLALRRLGVPQRFLFSLLTSNFHVVSGKERFQESLKKIVGMGFDPTTSKFVRALCVVYQMSHKTTEEKVNLYRKLGFSTVDVWEIFKKNPLFLALSEKNIVNSFETFIGLGFSRDEFVTMVKHCPQCIGLSAESVKKKTEFLVKEMNWSLKALVSNPAVFGYNLEKRTVPRCYVIKALMSKGLLGSELPPLSPVLAVTDEAFLTKYVMKHDDDKELVAELMSIYRAS
ncbi:Mitochondrial transcription termination factor family protein [Raphanus sativus]|nr:Mitochondrial transcription termination factor family protein [Raphanus sativus]